MYRASASDETRRERLKTIGHQLRLALQLARDPVSGSMAPRAVRERATGALGRPGVRAIGLSYREVVAELAALGLSSRSGKPLALIQVSRTLKVAA
jgi:hypothetical protein